MQKSLTLVLVLFVISSFAQDYKFGKVSKEELQETFYPLDSTAEAAYLYKNRKTYYTYSTSNGFEVITEVHQRIKIYSKEGFNDATFNIRFIKPDNGSYEKVGSIKANTYNLNKSGEITKDKVSKKEIFTEKLNKFRSIKKITMPNIKIGSVIEIQYTLNSPYDRYIDDLRFQHHIPVKEINYKIEYPEWFIFNKKNIGHYSIFPIKTLKNGKITFSQRVSRGNTYSGPSSTLTKGNINLRYNVFEYKAKNIPALKDDEPFVSNIDNYRGGVKFELASTDFVKVGGGVKNYSNSWKNVSKQIFKSPSFGAELDKSNYYKDDISAILATNLTEIEKTGAIFQFVKTKVKWNGYYNKYVDKGVRKAYKEGTGNVADINLMLTSMLRSAGVNANPVLVSTRKNGIPIFPTLDGFNYVISMVEFEDGTYALLDATEPYSVPNMLPARVLNWNGRKVTKEGNSSWITLTSSKHALKENRISANITEDLIIEGLIRTTYSQLNALNFRRKYNHIKEESLITQFEENNNVEVENFKISNKDKIDKSVIRNVKFTSEDLIEVINGKIYIEPLLFLTEHTNPFKLEDRKYPVDFTTPWKNKNTISIKIPEGYKIVSIPTSFAIAMPDNIGVFKYLITQVGKNIKILTNLQFNSAIIGAENYKTLKLFYGDLVKKQSEKIVLIKE